MLYVLKGNNPYIPVNTITIDRAIKFMNCDMVLNKILPN